MANARVARGRKTNSLVAEYFRKWWPDTRATFGTEPGRDVKNMFGLAPEVKATRDGDLLAALRQAVKNSDGDLPFVVWRPDGYGPEKIEDWVMAFRLGDGTRLLLEAGYGNKEGKLT